MHTTETVRHNWEDAEVQAIYDLPITDLIFQAQSVHRTFHDPKTVQLCTLLSIKTGGCPEDCSYCPQSVKYNTGLKAHRLLDTDDVLRAAAEAQAQGSTRFCMGAAWREVRDNRDFDRVIDMVKGVASLGMEVCTTLGMVSAEQAQRLADAGVTAYNHNLDTGPDYYERIVSTRTYDDRLNTLQAVRQAGMHVCCGGIIGMGELLSDRIALLSTLGRMTPHPESVPINALVRVAGTPLEKQEEICPVDIVRMVATARIVMPKSRVRLSAGRAEMSLETQTLCFLAGANSIFTGEKLLTTPNPEHNEDLAMLTKLGLTAQQLPHQPLAAGAVA